MVFSCLLDRHGDEVGGKLLELLPIVDGLLEFRRVLGRNPLTEIGPLAPDLVFEIGAGLLSRGTGAVLGFEAAQFHGIDGGHFLEDGGAFGGKIERRIWHNVYILDTKAQITTKIPIQSEICPTPPREIPGLDTLSPYRADARPGGERTCPTRAAPLRFLGEAGQESTAKLQWSGMFIENESNPHQAPAGRHGLSRDYSHYQWRWSARAAYFGRGLAERKNASRSPLFSDEGARSARLARRRSEHARARAPHDEFEERGEHPRDAEW
jgi:hypothetical protein